MLNMFTKHKSKYEVFVAICWNYDKWYILIVKSNCSTG